MRWQMSRMQIRWSYLFWAQNRYIVAVYGKSRLPVICCQREVRSATFPLFLSCQRPFVPVMATVFGVIAPVHTVSVFLFPLPSLSLSKYPLPLSISPHFFRRTTNCRLSRSFLPSFFHTRVPTTISTLRVGFSFAPHAFTTLRLSKTRNVKLIYESPLKGRPSFSPSLSYCFSRKLLFSPFVSSSEPS